MLIRNHAGYLVEDRLAADPWARVEPRPVDVQRLARDERDDVRIALHEAGHAVAAYRLHLAPSVATIVATPELGADGWSKHLDVMAPSNDRFTAGSLRSSAIVTLAGVAVDVIEGHGISRGSEGLRQGSASDFAAAERLLGVLRQIFREDVSTEGLLRETHELMSEPSNRAAVRFLALALLAHRTLNGPELAHYIRASDIAHWRTRTS